MGEILWGVIGKEVTKRPRWVLRVGQHGLVYLNGTMDTTSSTMSHESQAIEERVEISYAPQEEKSVQGIVAVIAGATVQWETTSQSCLALSTAEAELYSYAEALTMGDSLQALWTKVHGETPEIVTYGDSQAAISIVRNTAGWTMADAASSTQGECASTGTCSPKPMAALPHGGHSANRRLLRASWDRISCVHQPPEDRGQGGDGDR